MENPLYNGDFSIFGMIMERSEIINKYISKYNLSSYLEIGTRNKEHNFNLIKCREKLCIDPDPNAVADLVLTSDEFFKINNKKFDFIFVDGLHEAHQVYRDIKNGLKALNPGGIIMCHDCNPQKIEENKDFEEYEGTENWNGYCWKGFVKYRYESKYKCYVLNHDSGCGIIDTNIPTELTEEIIFHINEMCFPMLNEYRNKWLNLNDDFQFKS